MCRLVDVFPLAHAVRQGLLVDFQSFDNVLVCRHIISPEAGSERTHSLEFATSPPGMRGNVTHTAGNVSWKNHHPDRDCGEGRSLFFIVWPHQELFLVEVPVWQGDCLLCGAGRGMKSERNLEGSFAFT